MKSIDVANAFINRYGKNNHITNFKLNKLVLYANLESFNKKAVPQISD